MLDMKTGLRLLGLCSHCDEIVAMEKLPDSYTMKRAREIRKDYTGQPLFQLTEKDYATYLASQEGFLYYLTLRVHGKF